MRTTNLALIVFMLLLPFTSFAAIMMSDITKGAKAARCIQDPSSCSDKSSTGGSSGDSSFPFCVIAVGNKQCNYMDGTYCQQVAANLGGMCVTNPNFKSSVYGNQPFCVISRTGTECFYSDVDSCRQAAQVASGGCIPNPNK